VVRNATPWRSVARRGAARRRERTIARGLARQSAEVRLLIGRAPAILMA